MKTVNLSAVKTAKLIRADLKKAFPGVKFSVTCDRFSGGSSIDVRYEDGPLHADVKKIARAYGHAQFNGMEDLKESVSGKMVMTDEGPVMYDCGAWIEVYRSYSDKMRARTQKALECGWKPKLDSAAARELYILESRFINATMSERVNTLLSHWDGTK